MGPKLTVVITTSNRLGYLQQAVASVRVEGRASHELIVVDNGSTDGTADWLRSQAEHGVTMLHLPADPALPRAARVSAARNAGLIVAQGEYVWFLDDDDRLRPEAPTLMAAALERHPAAVAAVGARWRFGDGVAGGRVAHPLRPLLRDLGTELLLGWNCVPSQTLFRRAALRRAGPWSERVQRAEDIELLARLLPLGPVALEPDIVVEYRVHGSQANKADRADGHDLILRPHARALAGGSGARGTRLRDAGRLWTRANMAFDQGEAGSALTSTVRAVVLAPTLVTSPVLRPLSTRMLVRASLRGWGPTRRWLETRSQLPAETPRRGAGFLS